MMKRGKGDALYTAEKKTFADWLRNATHFE